MSVLDLCAGRRALSAFIAVSMVSCLLPQPRTLVLWAVTGLAVLLLGWAFACSLLPGFTCNITALTVAASTFWATYGTWEALSGAGGGGWLLKLTLAGIMGALFVAFDLDGSSRVSVARG